MLKEKSLKKYLLAQILLSLLIIACGGPLPGDVVREWIKVYGKDMDRAAQLTTLAFRNGKPRSLWAMQTHKNLTQIKYKHLGGAVIKKETKGKRSVVILQSRIYAIGGYADQKEIYYLKRLDGRWLIDDIEVSDEILEGEKKTI
jgi:hypothetical protein